MLLLSDSEMFGCFKMIIIMRSVVVLVVLEVKIMSSSSSTKFDNECLGLKDLSYGCIRYIDLRQFIKTTIISFCQYWC